MLSSLSHSLRLLFLLPTTLTAIILASVIEEGVNAQTSDKPPVIIQADTQDFDSKTGEIIAKGNVSFVYPSAQIQGRAKQARYVSQAKRTIVLIGDVHILQRGESLQAEKVTCLLEQGKCISSEE